MKGMIYINNTVRIRRLDQNSLAVEEYRTPDQTKASTKNMVKKWYVCGYYGKLKEALIGVLNKQLFDSVKNEMTIDEVIAKIDEVRSEIIEATDKMIAEGKA